MDERVVSADAVDEPGVSQPEQFTSDIDRVAHIAAQRVQQLREQFSTPGVAAEQLTSRPTRLAESRLWHLFHSGAAAALSGDVQTARRCFDSIAINSLEPYWAHELARRAAQLRELDYEALRSQLTETIHATRLKVDLPTAEFH